MLPTCPSQILKYYTLTAIITTNNNNNLYHHNNSIPIFFEVKHTFTSNDHIGNSSQSSNSYCLLTSNIQYPTSLLKCTKEITAQISLSFSQCNLIIVTFDPSISIGQATNYQNHGINLCPKCSSKPTC